MLPSIKPTWEHANSRFICVTLGVIDTLQSRYLSEQSLESVIPDISLSKAETIVAESLEADLIWNLPAEELLSGIFAERSISDFKRVALFEILFTFHRIALEHKEKDRAGEFWALAMATLQKVAESPLASPLLWYEDIFWELSSNSRLDAPDESIDWLKRGLAYNLHFNEGNNAYQHLLDIADVYMLKGDLNQGAKILTKLLHHDPANIWSYNLMAISFDKYGLTEIGTQAIQRGLELIKQRGNEEQLQDQLEDRREAMENSSIKGREANLDAAIRSNLRDALTLDFDIKSSQPIESLCHELIPDLFEVPVKRPMTPGDFPLPDRDEILAEFRRFQKPSPKRKTKRGWRWRKKSL